MAVKMFIPAIEKMQKQQIRMPIVDITVGAPVTVANFEVTGHGLANGDLISSKGYANPPPAIDLRDEAITVVDPDNFTVNIDVQAGPAYGGGGFVLPQLNEDELKARGDIIRLLDDDIAIALINDDGAGDPYIHDSTHEFLSDVSAFADAIRADSKANATFAKYLSALLVRTPAGTPTGSAFDHSAATFVIESVPGGETVNAMLLYKDTGDPTTSPLIFYIDDGAGFNITPTGVNATLTFDDGDNRIFRTLEFCP